MKIWEAKFFGLFFFIAGPIVTLFSWLFLSLSFPASILPSIIPVAIFLISMISGFGFLTKGKSIKKKELESKEKSREKLLNAFAAKHDGILNATSVATLLGISKEEAESYVVDLMKQERPISFEIDNDGEFVFYFDRPGLSPKEKKTVAEFHQAIITMEEDEIEEDPELFHNARRK